MNAGNRTGRRTHTWFARLRRFLKYRLLIPLFRSPHPPEFTARGVAIGVFWGATPFIGAQTMLMIGTWYVLKHVFRKDASMVQALAWAWINNPITMIPMYYGFYVTGLWLTGTPETLRGYDAFVALWEAGANQPMLARVDLLARQLGVALSVGSLPYAMVGSWMAYRWALGIVRARRHRIRRARAHHVRPASARRA